MSGWSASTSRAIRSYQDRRRNAPACRSDKNAMVIQTEGSATSGSRRRVTTRRRGSIQMPYTIKISPATAASAKSVHAPPRENQPTPPQCRHLRSSRKKHQTLATCHDSFEDSCASLPHQYRHLCEPMRVAPFIVIPRENLHQIAVYDLRERKIYDGGRGISDEIT